MNHNKNIFETIIEVLRRANLGFSINEETEVSDAIKPDHVEQAQETIETENACTPNGE